MAPPNLRGVCVCACVCIGDGVWSFRYKAAPPPHNHHTRRLGCVICWRFRAHLVTHTWGVFFFSLRVARFTTLTLSVTSYSLSLTLCRHRGRWLCKVRYCIGFDWLILCSGSYGVAGCKQAPGTYDRRLRPRGEYRHSSGDWTRW